MSGADEEYGRVYQFAKVLRKYYYTDYAKAQGLVLRHMLKKVREGRERRGG